MSISHPGVFVEEVPGGVRTIEGVPTSITAFVGDAPHGLVDAPKLIDSFADYESLFGGLSADDPMSCAVYQYFLNGGARAIIVRLPPGGTASAAARYAGGTHRADQTGLYSLLKTDIFNILVLPPPALDADVDGEVLRAALALCVERRAMLVVDPPAAWRSADDAAKGIENFALSGDDARNAALYFPRLRVNDPSGSGGQIEVPPSGAVAGIYARTDAQRGVWKAPAGLDAALVGVSRLSIPLNDQENGRLNPLAVNCLRSFPAAGTLVWGARTLRGADGLASEWKYVPVRRLALFIEESLYRGTRWVVYEPNGEPLWARIRLSVGAFMHNLFRQGAFQGRSPREAYFVKCDGETTTQNDVNLGVVNILVGFAPLKPAEFIIIKIQQRAEHTAA